MEREKRIDPGVAIRAKKAEEKAARKAAASEVKMNKRVKDVTKTDKGKKVITVTTYKNGVKKSKSGKK